MLSLPLVMYLAFRLKLPAELPERSKKFFSGTPREAF
jgi:hypothetical protein